MSTGHSDFEKRALQAEKAIESLIKRIQDLENGKKSASSSNSSAPKGDLEKVNPFP